jgi:hypothetical protein
VSRGATMAAAALAAALALGTLAAHPLHAADQQGFTLGGDVDARALGSQANGAGVFPAAPGVTAGAFIDGTLSFSRQYTTLGLLDFTFQETNVLDPASGAKVESLSFLVNELYADVNFGDLFFLRLGKQRLKWGAGFLYNPSDPVNPPKDPTALRAVREGVTALKAELITKPLSLMAFGVFYDSLEQTGVGAKVSTSALPGTDIALSGYWSQGQSWTAALNTSLTPFADLPGWDTLQLWVEGSLSEKGRYAAYAPGSLPGAAVPVATTGMQYSILVGTTATLPEIRTVALVEYYHLSDGLSGGQLGAVYAALRSSDPAVVAQSAGWYAELARRPARQGTDYLFLSLAQPSITDSGDPVLDKIGLSATCLVSLVDGSFYATGGVTTAFVKDSSVDLAVVWANGAPGAEFGNAPATLAVALDVKVFF